MMLRGRYDKDIAASSTGAMSEVAKEAEVRAVGRTPAPSCSCGARHADGAPIYQVNLAMAEIAESEDDDDDNPLDEEVFMAPLSSDDDDKEHGWAEGLPQPMPSPPATEEHVLSAGGDGDGDDDEEGDGLDALTALDGADDNAGSGGEGRAKPGSPVTQVCARRSGRREYGCGRRSWDRS
jgi:hypothetical protein